VMKKANKVALGPAFLNKLGNDEYGLYRNVIMRNVDKETNEVLEEQVLEQPVGPLLVLRRARDDEKPTMVSSDPVTKQPLPLVVVWDARIDLGGVLRSMNPAKDA
jgi:hypothetical protein